MSRVLRLVPWLAALFVAYSLILSAWSPPSNCGGNSAALAEVSQIAMVARIGAVTSSNDSFSFAVASGEQREQLAMLSRSHWSDSSRILVSLQPIRADVGEQCRVIVACDTPYRNVPQSWFGLAPPAHAVAYSDGTSGLISPDEFAALDLSKFVPMDELYPSKSQ